ncbi:hypothetical protein [Kitasatospora sp. NPDC051914]|uniref:hypothetical protein n=1 Tax=Kitasatospora sp. NPDC051914 TaxID=3154945 RepID=UPI003438246E
MEATEPGTRPYLVLAGFALLLTVVFGGSFALGKAVGPVAPGLRPATGGVPAGGHSDGPSPGSPSDGMPGHVMGAAR